MKTGYFQGLSEKITSIYPLKPVAGMAGAQNHPGQMVPIHLEPL
jgi:hypothetical protein